MSQFSFYLLISSLPAHRLRFGGGASSARRSDAHSKVRTRMEGEKLLLHFRDPTSDDGGTYICRSRFQVSVSLAAQVEVSFYQDVTFEDCPTSQSLVKGRTDGFIRCGVSANPAPIISWLKDDRPVSEDRYVIENNGIRVRGLIDESDAGRFDVAARVEETGEVLYQLITVEVYGECVSLFASVCLCPPATVSARLPSCALAVRVSDSRAREKGTIIHIQQMCIFPLICSIQASLLYSLASLRDSVRLFTYSLHTPREAGSDPIPRSHRRVQGLSVSRTGDWRPELHGRRVRQSFL